MSTPDSINLKAVMRISNGRFYAKWDTIPHIIDTIAADLIASGAWTDADVTFTTTVQTAESCRRALKHTADSVYLTLVMENYSTGMFHNPYYQKGLVAVMSSGWDSVGHAPSGTLQFTFIPIWFYSGSFSQDLAMFNHEIKLYTSADGFALVIAPKTMATAASLACVLIVERNTSKLYADAFSNFYMFADFCPQYSPFNTSGSNIAMFGVNYKWWRVSRPFNYQSQTGIDYGYGATLSEQDGKVYYSKPIIHNGSAGTSPIYECELWFALTRSWQQKTPGLVSGDEISIPGTEKTYCVGIAFSGGATPYGATIETLYALAIRKHR